MSDSMAPPRFIYGTAWKEERTAALVSAALGAGFRAIDTANQRKHYVESAAGEAISAAISAGTLRREELFLQTKYTYARGQDHRLPYDANARPAEQVAQSFHSSLEHLNTDYIDAYLLHGPSSGAGWSEVDWEVWRAMESLQQGGKARTIGVSNVTLAQLDILVRGAKVSPSYVQNRCYARTGWDRDIRGYCRDRKIGYQGFSLLTANVRELASPAVAAIARRLGCTPAQVTFAFSAQAGMIPLTGTSSGAHLREDLLALELHLSGEEMEAVERAGRG